MPDADAGLGEREDALSIAEVYDEVEVALARVFPRGRSLWVRGEIQNVSDQARSGHCFIDLIDPESAGERQAPVLRVKCWRSTWGPLKSTLVEEGIELQPGMVVMLRGALDFYRARAEIGFIMAELDVTSLLGRLAAQRAALLRALAAEGLLEANRRLPVPPVPLRIGLVASPGTEGYRDFVGQLSASGLAFHVLVAPVGVQGTDAPRAIARGLTRVAGAACDLAVLVRGGGSKADLGAFDSEPVARAVATCPVPVWTGIGHTGDESVADVVSNRSFITPTECGRELAQRVAQWWDESVVSGARTVGRRVREVLAAAEHRDVMARGRLTGAARHQLRAHAERLTVRTGRISERGRFLPEEAERSLSERSARLGPLARDHLVREGDRLGSYRRLLAAYDVDRQLERGYTLTVDASGAVVRSAGQLREGAELVTRFADGTARSRVEAVTIGLPVRGGSVVGEEPVDVPADEPAREAIESPAPGVREPAGREAG
ncbi:MAG TPA: exodeoxyribonuclease VII large subunit [Acidimicrobiales bacterium]|nr:exodeoxyribonuclease VII large subunit [Acidimicrobiales bacterium]